MDRSGKICDFFRSAFAGVRVYIYIWIVYKIIRPPCTFVVKRNHSNNIYFQTVFDIIIVILHTFSTVYGDASPIVFPMISYISNVLSPTAAAMIADVLHIHRGSLNNVSWLLIDTIYTTVAGDPDCHYKVEIPDKNIFISFCSSLWQIEGSSVSSSSSQNWV